jgi:ceramide glucosyltransferase
VTGAAGLALLWWGAGLALLCGSALAAIAQPSLARRRAGSRSRPPVSILVPLKEPGPGLSEATASLFALDYPDFDVTFCAGAADPLALDTVRSAMPPMARRIWHIALSSPPAGGNPKVANLAGPLLAAAHDHVLIKDARTLLPVDALSRMAASMGPGVGLVIAVPICTGAANLAGAAEEAFVNSYGARLVLAASSLGLGVGLGAAMLVRRSDIARSDALASMAASVADDHALAVALGRIGLSTRCADARVFQLAGHRRWRDLWNRHRRWALCRRMEAPVVFALEPCVGALGTSLAGALAAPALGLAPSLAALGTLAAWIGIEILLCRVKGWPLHRTTPLAILMREALLPALWGTALMTRRIGWGGEVIALDALRNRAGGVR